MDPSTAVRTDTLPAIATVVVPGALASSGYLWMAVAGASPSSVTFLASHEAIATLGAVLIWVAAGFAIDSAASYVEVYTMDRRRSNHDEMLDYWWRYLEIAWTKEPIGQHYIRRMLVSFKFELNMCVAALVALPSVPLLMHYGLLSGGRGTIASFGLLSAALILFVFARSSSDVLANVRRRLVQDAPRINAVAEQPNEPLQPTSGAVADAVRPIE